MWDPLRLPPNHFTALLIAAGATAISGGLLLLCPPPARPQPLSDKPFPAIEAGMHTAPIVRMGVDREGRYGVTASHDKTARLWDLRTGQQLAVLRVPLGDQQEGRLDAAALSPDGRWVALGGFTGPGAGTQSIYIFDRASGQIAHRIAALPNVIFHLAFSPDGRHLAAALGGANGIRLYSATSWQEVTRDSDYQADSYSVHFAQDGRLVATSLDGELRLYNPSFETIARRPIPGGKQPFFARFSPDGSRIAVGFHDSTKVSVVSGNDLTLLHTADTDAVQGGNLMSVAWSADGRRLYAAGLNALPDGTNPIRFWDQRGQGPLQTLTLPTITDTVMDLRPQRDGRLLFASQDPAWGVLDGRGKPQTGQGPPILDHRGHFGAFQAFRLSPAGQPQGLKFMRATWHDGRWRRSLARFDLTTRQLRSIDTSTSSWAAPRTTGLPVRNWENSTEPLLGEVPLPLKPLEISRSLAVGPDSRRFALGSEWYVHLFDAKGQRIWRQPVPSVAWMVNLSADGRFVVAALGDGTIRWYRVSNGTEALALFVHGDGDRWVLWTPEGFYDASPGADDLIGYHLNRGRDQAGEFVGSDQLAQLFFRPDLISRRLAGDEAAITAAAAKVGDVREVLAAGLPPEIALVSAASASVSDAYELRVRVKGRSGGVGRVEIRVNGVEVQGRADPPTGGMYSQRLKLPPGEVKVSVRVYSRGDGLASKPVEAKVSVAPPAELPTLHVLAVGVSAYRDASLANGVRFAATDAQSVAAVLTDDSLKAMARIAPAVVLNDDAVTKEGLRAALGDFAARVKPADLFVLHLAGHGTALDGEYYFYPYDLLPSSNAVVRERAISGEELNNLLKPIRANKTVVLLDTCNSGQFRLPDRSTGDRDSINRFARLSGRVVLAAAGDENLALEHPERRSGIFSGALISGLRGDADTDKDGFVEVHELGEFVVMEVQRISEQRFGQVQSPWIEMHGNFFPVTRKAATSGR